jgi:hypothetical protein
MKNPNNFEAGSGLRELYNDLDVIRLTLQGGLEVLGPFPVRLKVEFGHR